MFPNELKHFFDSANFYAGAPLRDIFDVEKSRVLRTIHAYSKLSWRALSGLYDAASSLEHERIPGDVVACGPSIGPAAALVASVVEENRARRVWVFDSSPDSPDLFRKLYLNPRGKYFKGFLVDKKDDIGSVALLYLDGAQSALPHVYDQVVSGGFIFVGDFHRPSLDEFLTARGARADLRKIDGGFACFRKH